MPTAQNLATIAQQARIQHLVVRAQAGDKTAIQEIFLHFQEPIVLYLKSIVHNDEVAQDLWQDTCLRVMKRLHQYQPIRPFGSWLFTLAHNLAVNYCRADKRAPVELTEALEHAMATIDEPLQKYVNLKLREIIYSALATLPDDYQVIFQMYEGEELSYTEIANTLGCPIGTVKSSLYRARAELCKKILEAFPGIVADHGLTLKRTQ